LPHISILFVLFSFTFLALNVFSGRKCFPKPAHSPLLHLKLWGQVEWGCNSRLISGQAKKLRPRPEDGVFQGLINSRTSCPMLSYPIATRLSICQFENRISMSGSSLAYAVILVNVETLRSGAPLFCCKSGILPRPSTRRRRMPLLQNETSHPCLVYIELLTRSAVRYVTTAYNNALTSMPGTGKRWAKVRACGYRKTRWYVMIKIEPGRLSSTKRCTCFPGFFCL